MMNGINRSNIDKGIAASFMVMKPAMGVMPLLNSSYARSDGLRIVISAQLYWGRTLRGDRTRNCPARTGPAAPCSPPGRGSS